jgi:hypothetical protein
MGSDKCLIVFTGVLKTYEVLAGSYHLFTCSTFRPTKLERNAVFGGFRRPNLLRKYDTVTKFEILSVVILWMMYSTVQGTV